MNLEPSFVDVTLLATIVFWVLVASIAVQGGMACYFIAALRRWKRNLPSDEECPKVAVVLCLRGSDPFLPSCVEALLKQDYPRYDVRAVLDSREDPAWRVVANAVARCGATHLKMEVLTERRDTCSLKCSSLVQAISALDDSYEAVALADADTVPHPTWLRELVAPLADPRVGAATGNRWYMPVQGSWASLVRYLWNAAAIVQMYWYSIPWGGTLAFKLQALRRSDLLQRWGNAFCEDTMVYGVLRRQRLRVAFVPSLMMVNRESCEMAGFFEWVRRQLLAARLYHPGWPAVVFHGIAAPLLLVLTLALLLAALWSGHGQAAAWIGAGLACYLGPLPVLLAAMELSVRRIVRARGEPVGWLSLPAAARLLPAIFLTQAVYSLGLVSAVFLRSVDWRRVRYTVRGPWEIRLTEYRPYASDSPAGDAASSL